MRDSQGNSGKKSWRKAKKNLDEFPIEFPETAGAISRIGSTETEGIAMKIPSGTTEKTPAGICEVNPLIILKKKVLE